MLDKIIDILSVPIIILNIAGSIVGGIWLAILGEWKLIGTGVFLMVTSHWVARVINDA